MPPFFVFTKAPLYGGRAVQFRGLAVPGANGVAPIDDLVAVWKSFAGQRFQNYRALFTVLETPRVSRAWLEDLRVGQPLSDSCPAHWRQWVDEGSYRPLHEHFVRAAAEPAQGRALPPAGGGGSALLTWERLGLPPKSMGSRY